jgi:hypothetical protein
VVLSWEGRVVWGGVAGPRLIAAASLCWALVNNLTQKGAGGDPVQIAMLKGLAAGTVNTIIAVNAGGTCHPHPRALPRPAPPA